MPAAVGAFIALQAAMSGVLYSVEMPDGQTVVREMSPARGVHQRSAF
jgi:hypothetical protein